MLMNLIAISLIVLGVHNASLPDLCKDAIKHFIDEYECINPGDTYIGKGSSARTFLVKEKDGVIKRVLKVELNKEDNQSKIVDSIYRRTKESEHIIKRHKKKISKNFIYEIIDYGEYGNFAYYMNSQSKPSYKIILSRIRFIAEGLMDLHKAGFVHADLKLENIVVNKFYRPVLIDFDLSVRIDSNASPRGSEQYCEPQLLENWTKKKLHRYTEGTDKWSLGVMLYKLVMGDFPFNPKGEFSREEKLALIKKGKIKFRKGVNFDNVWIIMSLLRRDPQERLDLETLSIKIKKILSSQDKEFLRKTVILNINDKVPENIRELYRMIESESGIGNNTVLLITIEISILFAFVGISLLVYFLVNKNKEDQVENIAEELN